jgi:hypothetical protein
MTTHRARLAWAGVACLAFVTTVAAAPAQKDTKSGKDAKDDDAKKPKLSLKAQPMVSMSPSRVVLTAELAGGANDYEQYYCPTVEWDWGDGTQSESTTDCNPYVSGKSEIKRRFTVEHIFRAGNYRVIFRLKRNDKPLAMATATIQVQPGVRDIR